MADELRSALELATDDELRGLTEILFRRQFNPIDYLYAPDPIDVQSLDREDWLDSLEQRFRFLAADGVTVLRRQTEQLTYRQVLIQVCRHLKIPYSSSFSTTELEAEVFLCILGRAWKHLPASEQKDLTLQVERSFTETQLSQHLPLPFRKDPVGLFLKGGGALAVTAVLRPVVLKQFAHQFAVQFAAYQVAKDALLRGGAVALQHHVAVQVAGRGMAVTAARYRAVRGAFAVLVPALWTWVLADLGWRTIATNHSRVIPTIFALAQIRLTRAPCAELA